MHATNYALPGSLTIVLTGDTGSGKTRQLAEAFSAKDDAGEDLFAPVAYVKAESSSEGTADALLADPSRCVLVDVPNLDLEVCRQILLDLFPPGAPVTVDEAHAIVHRHKMKAAEEGRGPRPTAPSPVQGGQRRLRGIAVETLTTIYKGQIETERRKAEAQEKANGKDREAKYGQLASRNTRELAKRAQVPFVSLVAQVAEISNRHRGVLQIITVHHRPRFESYRDSNGEQQKRIIGVAPDVGYVPDVAEGIAVVAQSSNWDVLAAKANMIWAMCQKIPSLATVAAGQANNAYVAGHRPKFCAVTSRFLDVPGLGHVLWAKRQEGAGWASVFGQVPPLWDPDACAGYHLGDGPELGRVLAAAAMHARGNA